MIWEVNKTLTIPFLVTDSYSTPITTGVTPLCFIRNNSGQYWNSSNSTWGTSEHGNSMTHAFKGVWVFSFIPITQEQFIVRCSESVNKVEAGISIFTGSGLQYLDASVASRASVNPDNTGITNLNSKLTDTRANLLDNLDMKISDIPTTNEIWEHTSRALSPSNTQGIGSCSVTVNTTNVTSIEIYDSNNVARYELIPSANVGTIKLNPGLYYFVALKDNYYTKQITVVVPSASTYSVDISLSPITSTEDLNIKFREVNAKTIYKDDTIRIILEAFSTNGKEFTISNATSKESTNTLTTTVSGNKIYVTFHPTTAATFIIDTDVVIGAETYSVKTIKKVI